MSTDLPYYDRASYADLSDIFYVWLKYGLEDMYPAWFGSEVTPKKEELTAFAYRWKGDKDQANAFYAEGLNLVFSNMYNNVGVDYPASSSDVSDEQAVRLVILRPVDAYKARKMDCPALIKAAEILNTRGTSPRTYRNMLAFVAPDQSLLPDLKKAVSDLLAWESIKTDSSRLNLDAAQNAETASNITRCNETVICDGDQLLTKQNLIKRYNCYNIYKSCGSIITKTTRYSENHKSIIEYE